MFSAFRIALRGLSRIKGFTAVTLVTLALGIGSATAIFNVVDWVLFRSTDNPVVLTLFGAAVLLIALGACLVPAIRATRIDISRLFRAE